jgi:hypothetical protein
MHPEFLTQIAQAQREDLLRHHEFRERVSRARAGPERQPQRPFLQSRERVGSLLVRAGSRLMGQRQAGLELMHK